MEHYYHNLEGFFAFPHLYQEMVQRFNNNSKFVEVGSWKGQSAAFLAVEIINSSKNIELYCVDTWKGNNEEGHKNDPDVVDNTLYERFLSNVQPLNSVIKPIRLPSIEAALTFEDNSVDFVFIDASHEYEDVKADLNAWYPKIKSSGVFAGHDYRWPPVMQAVDEFCASKKLTIEEQEHSWVVRNILS